jgi:hypothetical protein
VRGNAQEGFGSLGSHFTNQLFAIFCFLLVFTRIYCRHKAVSADTDPLLKNVTILQNNARHTTQKSFPFYFDEYLHVEDI